MEGSRTARGWLLGRLISGLVTVVLVTLLVFLATRALPGDMARIVLGRDATADAVAALHRELGALSFYRGDPRSLIPKLVKEAEATGVVWNRCYDGHSVKRDTGIKNALKRDGIEAKGGAWSREEEAAFKAPIRERYDAQAHPYYATARLWDDGVLDPADSRRVLGLSLAATLNAPIAETQFGVFRM